MAKNEITALSDSLADAVENASSITVLVNGRRRMPASGIVLRENLILTASHVVEIDEDIQVILPGGKEVSAELVGRDPASDLALLKLEEPTNAQIETSSEMRAGQLVLALGRPTTGGIEASLGVVSAVGGPSRTHLGGVLERHIRTDAIPYPGFSGGPLINTEGKVIGINTSGLGHGNLVAIPIELAQKIAGSLEEHGSVKRGYLGVQTQNVPLPGKAEFDRRQECGLLIVGVEADSPAEEAGLMTGDIIVGFNKHPVESHDDLFTAMTGPAVGNPAPMEVLRGGKQMTLNVTLRERKRSERQFSRRMMFCKPFGPHHEGESPHFGHFRHHRHTRSDEDDD